MDSGSYRRGDSATEVQFQLNFTHFLYTHCITFVGRRERRHGDSGSRDRGDSRVRTAKRRHGDSGSRDRGDNRGGLVRVARRNHCGDSRERGDSRDRASLH